MDIAGAKALTKRLGLNGAAEPEPARTDVDVSEDAPPVYKWTGVSRPEPEALPAAADDEPAARSVSLFRPRLELQLVAARPNQLWCADIKYART